MSGLNTPENMQKYDNAQDNGYIRLHEKYQELIMAVARKFPNETRHETALRYINQAEALSECASVPHTNQPD